MQRNKKKKKKKNNKEKKRKKKKIFYMHSVSALSKKVEDNESRELDVSRKETAFNSLIMFRIRNFLMPFTMAQIICSQKKVSPHKKTTGFSLYVSNSGDTDRVLVLFITHYVQPSYPLTSQQWQLLNTAFQNYFPQAKQKPFTFKWRHLLHLVMVVMV